MATFVYTAATNSFVSGAFVWPSMAVNAALVDLNYLPKTSDLFLSDIPPSAIVKRDLALTGLAQTTDGIMYGSVPRMLALAWPYPVAALVLYNKTGLDSTSNLLYYSSDADNMPFRPLGLNWEVQYNQIRKGFFQIHVTSPPAPPTTLIALSNSNRIGRSTDFATFAAIPTPSNNTKLMTAVAFSPAQNRIIIVCSNTGGGARSMYSNDAGLTWIDDAGLSSSVQWHGIARSDTLGVWVAVGYRVTGAPQVYVSTTGTSGWTLANTGLATDCEWGEVLWIEEFGLFVIASIPDSIFNNTHMASSPDGSTWTMRTANDGGWGNPERIVKIGAAVYGYGLGSSTIIKTVNGTTYTGGNLVFAGKASLGGLADGTRAFLCKDSPNALTETAGGSPLVQANWSAFVDLGSAYLDVWVANDFGPNKVIAGKSSAYRLSSDGGLTFGAEVAWPGAVAGTFAMVRSSGFVVTPTFTVTAWPPVLLSDLVGALPRVWPVQDDVTAHSIKAR